MTCQDPRTPPLLAPKTAPGHFPGPAQEPGTDQALSNTEMLRDVQPQSHQAQCTLGLMLCGCHLEILSNF